MICICDFKKAFDIFKRGINVTIIKAQRRWASLLCITLHPQKGITIRLFLTYQAFINREGIISRQILTEGLQI